MGGVINHTVICVIISGLNNVKLNFRLVAYASWWAVVRMGLLLLRLVLLLLDLARWLVGATAAAAGGLLADLAGVARARLFGLDAALGLGGRRGWGQVGMVVVSLPLGSVVSVFTASEVTFLTCGCVQGGEFPALLSMWRVPCKAGR